MNTQLVVAVAVEGLLASLCFVLFNFESKNGFFRWAGTVMVCLTFSWSVILGCVLALNNLTLRI